MRALLLVLAAGCTSNGWENDFEGEFRVTTYTVGCDSVSMTPPQASFHFAFIGPTLRFVEWCDGDHDCDDEDWPSFAVAREGLAYTSSSAFPRDTAGPSVECVLTYDVATATRTSESGIVLERHRYELVQAYDATCVADQAPRAGDTGACTSSIYVVGELGRATR